MKKLIFPFFIAIFLMGGVFVPHANAQSVTIADLQAQIQQLLNTIAQLQAQVAALSGQQQASPWCHTFNTNLRFGDRNAEVIALQTALQKEGVYLGGDNASGQSQRSITFFGEATAAAVVGFQQKYAQEVLVPWGLPNGTGFVGGTTRAKLNALYGCAGNPIPPPGVVPPVTGPSITSLNPTFGPIGTSVTIAGSGFTATGNKVKFGNLGSEDNPSYSLNSFDGRTLVFKVPSSNYFACWYSNPACEPVASSPSPGAYQVSVINSNGTRSNAVNFTVTSGTATALPDLVVPGDTIIAPTSGTVDQDVSIVFTIVNQGNAVASPAVYSYTNQAGGFSTLHPLNTCTGSTVLQPGASCVSAYKLRFSTTGVKNLEVKLDPSNQIQESNENNNTVSITLTINSTIAPSVTVLSPNGGEKWVRGKSYQVKWDGMRCGKSCNAFFNLTGNGRIYPLGEESIGFGPSIGNHATVRVPSLITTGSYRFQMTLIDNGTRVYDNSDGFITVVDSAVNIPSITSLNPTFGPIGASVTITGSGFTATGNKVKFGNLGSEDNPSYSLNSFDGRTLVFKVPSSNYLACWYSTLRCLTPAYSPSPGAYQVSVINSNGTRSNAVNFTVTSGAVTLTPTITVLSPNGGEAWTTGQTYDITWQSSGADKINIAVDYSKALSLTIASGVDASSGRYSWTIPPDFFTQNSQFQPGQNFTISVVRAKADGNYDYTVQDESNGFFSIVDPSITVLSPNGGEEVIAGETYNITWNQTGLEGKTVEVLLKTLDHTGSIISPKENLRFRDGESLYGIGSVSATAQSMSWAVPSDLLTKVGQPDQAPTQFKIVLLHRFKGMTVAGDESDNSFSVILLPPCGSYGDVNGDGFVTAEDNEIIMQFIVRLVTPTADQKERADVNDDGAVTILDSITTLQYITGLVDTFPVCSSAS